MENSIASRKARVREAMRMAHIGSWEYDLATQKLYCSEELKELCGITYDTNSPEGQLSFISLIPPEDLEMIREALKNEKNLVTGFSHRLIRPEGKIIYLKQTVNKMTGKNKETEYYYGTAQDITESVEYQQKLEASESRFRSLIEHGADLIGIIDEHGKYIYVAESSVILGYEPEYFMGKNAFDFIHPEDAPKVLAQLSSLSQVKSLVVDPFRFLAAKGDWKWVESTLTNLTADPVVGGIVVNSRDITHRVMLEAELKEEIEKRQKKITAAIVKAQEKERKEIGQELHDNVNQILSTVKLYLQVAADANSIKPEFVAKSLDLVQECIDEIRSISKKLSGSTNIELGLEEALMELVDSIALTGKIKIRFHSPAKVSHTLSEDTQLAIYRIVQEHLTNILKHAEASKADLTIGYLEDRLTLYVSDNGKGCDLNCRRAGVGMTNMLSRASAVEGTLAFTSSPGQGFVLSGSFPVDG